jgi:hypothetical protein
MNATVYHARRRWQRAATAILCVLAPGLMVVHLVFSAEPISLDDSSPPAPVQAFLPGETLTYKISWSNIITAGTAVMEVKEETLPDGRKALRFIASSRSVGLVEAVYPVRDRVESLFDPQIMQSLSFNLSESHGKKKRRRSLIFNHANRTVVSRLNDDPPKTLPIPDPVQDALSSLFYLRMQDDFTIGKTHVINVHDSGKNWAVDVYTLAREKITTPAGEFDTIKVKTFPKYDGVFMNKGDIFIWLTDDSRKIPVLMKSTIAIGSIMSTLTDMKLGDDQH